MEDSELIGAINRKLQAKVLKVDQQLEKRFGQRVKQHNQSLFTLFRTCTKSKSVEECYNQLPSAQINLSYDKIKVQLYHCINQAFQGNREKALEKSDICLNSFESQIITVTSSELSKVESKL